MSTTLSAVQPRDVRPQRHLSTFSLHFIPKNTEIAECQKLGNSREVLLTKKCSEEFVAVFRPSFAAFRFEFRLLEKCKRLTSFYLGRTFDLLSEIYLLIRLGPARSFESLNGCQNLWRTTK
jgi:hypothetical protein